MIEALTGKAARSFALATADLNVWEGSVRSSKTVASLLRWVEFVLVDAPPGNLLMIGKTERTLKRNVIDVLVEWLGTDRCRHVRGEGELWICGRRVYLAGANDEKAEDKIRGLTLAGVYVDEASLVPEGMWSMLLTRLSVDGAKLFATSNPGPPTHWLMRDYLKRARLHLRHDGTEVVDDGPDVLDLHRFSFNLRDNPTLTARFVAALERQFVGLWRKRFVDGLWVIADGAVYDTFDPEVGRHVTARDPRAEDVREWLVAVDYGTTNPFVALLIAVLDDRLVIVREWRWDSRAQRGQRTDAQYSAALRVWLDQLDAEFPGCGDPDRIIVDPSAASFIAQLYLDGWAGVRKADNTVVDGIRSTASLLAAGRLQIVDGEPATDGRPGAGCGGLIAEKAGYVWDPKAAERGVEQPLKVDDHGPDAERYGIMGARRWWRPWLTLDPVVDGDGEA